MPGTNTLIVFAKAPVQGRVKTRLLKNSTLDEAEVCDLYRSFLGDVLETAGRSRAENIFLHFDPETERETMRLIARDFIAPERLTLTPQKGGGFVARIAASFAGTFATGTTRAVMIGSDSPTLKTATLDRAFDLLAETDGAVLGPSGEGGIYLIGLNAGCVPDFTEIFNDGAELTNFARELSALGVPLTLLEEVTDIDVASDLVTLVSLIGAMRHTGMNGNSGFPRHTANMIEQLGLTVVRSGDGTRDKGLARG